MSVGPRAEKFNIVSNDYGRTYKSDFSVSDREHCFWTNFVQNIIIASLSWNSVPRLIRLCRIQWCCSIFLFSTGNTFFGQIKIFSFSWNLVPRLILICRIQWRCSLFLFYTGNTFFGKNHRQSVVSVSAAVWE